MAAGRIGFLVRKLFVQERQDISAVKKYLAFYYPCNFSNRFTDSRLMVA